MLSHLRSLCLSTPVDGRMSAIFTPANQVRLTNVSVVRLRKGGKRFEIACYRNTVQDWRSRVLRRLDDVLQSRQVFLNVSKGQVARDADLRAAFGAADIEAIIVEILAQGDVQVGAEERDAHLGSRTREVATIVAERVLNPRTRMPYPVAMVEQAMVEIVRFSPNMARSAKQQALDVIRVLEAQTRFPVVRAQMRLVISLRPETLDASPVENIAAGLDRLSVDGNGTPDDNADIEAEPKILEKPIADNAKQPSDKEGSVDTAATADGALWDTLRPLVASWDPHEEGSRERTVLIDPGNYRAVTDAAAAIGATVQLLTLRDRA